MAYILQTKKGNSEQFMSYTYKFEIREQKISKSPVHSIEVHLLHLLDALTLILKIPPKFELD